MPFRTPPRWAGTLPAVPDNVPLSDFMLNEQYGRYPLEKSLDPYTCALTRRTYSALQVKERDKVAAVYSVNTIDTPPLLWAAHRLGAVVSMANAAYTADELVYQLRDSKATSLFTCSSLLPTALQAAAKTGIPRSRVYLLETPENTPDTSIKTVSQLAEEGRHYPEIEELEWTAGEGARRTAFLCYSSGTSGLPKGVMISHRSVIANTLQIVGFEQDYRDSRETAEPEVALGLLPQSHIYSLIVICHAGFYRGDQTIIFPKYTLATYLAAIQEFKICSLFLVPPIIINMVQNADACSSHDLSSVTSIFTGAAPLGQETAAAFGELLPKVRIRQAYGLTETSTAVSFTHHNDIWFGSSGVLLPGIEVKLLSPEGKEISSYDTPGEVVVRTPSIALGYLNNDRATKESFKDGWFHTGDEGVFRLSPSGNEHLFIVDRIKELIKVKGLQDAPAELEAHLLTHPLVGDCAVIAVEDPSSGEAPRAIVVPKPNAGVDQKSAGESIQQHVRDHKARHKWLRGGIKFVDSIPKSPSGKILRRVLRDAEKTERKGARSRL
ncbi:hypothetical protein BJY04DRAFT_228865 [Aspergillus karnatakaensis]|uniref:acyl--CoA ligase n=1 Tax=Aspergillus karnatakaensis TaxID=1810916 RepID=UPI003CCE2D9B